jgi:4-amino-4-deoxy-L-arabinose transferase-like glycosyltransferase
MEKVAHSSFIKTPKSGRMNHKFSIFNFQFSIIDTLILFILLLAGFLRLYRIQDYMTFLGDEGRDVLVVYNILHGHLTLLGPTASVGGFFLGPIYYYFMTPFLWLSHYNPVGPAVMVALFGIATVWLVYKIGNEFLGFRAGLTAAILYSISPLVIAHSRSSWNPNLMPFFSVFSLYILYQAVKNNKFKLFIFCGVLLGISMQLHYLATFLAAITAVYVLLTRIILVQGYSLQKSVVRVLKDYFYILIGFIIGWSPFLLFEVRHGFPNLRSIANFVLYGEETGGSSEFFGIVGNVFFRIFGRLITNFPPPEQVSLQAHFPVAVWYFATIILGIASVSILAYHFLGSIRSQERFHKIGLLVLWLVIGIGLFGFYKKPIYDYYFGFMFPLPFILVGMTIVGLYTNLHEYVRYIGGSLSKSLLNRGQHELTPLRYVQFHERSFAGQARIRWVGKVLAVGVFLLLVWINLQGIPFRFPPNRQLAQVEELSRFVVNKTEGQPFNFALITGGNSDHAYRYFFTLWGKQPVAIENPEKDPERKTVTEQLLVVCETSPCAPLGHSLWEIAGFGRAEIVGEWSVSVVKVYNLRHYTENI